MSLVHATRSIKCSVGYLPKSFNPSVERVFDYTSVVYLDVKVGPKMPRTKSKGVSEGNGPAP